MMEQEVITIPHNFTPREYQQKAYNSLSLGYKRGVVVWHRRAGKDKTFINILAREAFKRVGLYMYILPYYAQARLIIWEGMDKKGFKFIDHFPEALVKRKENQQMMLELVNGSIIRLVGSDNINSIVGPGPVGIIFSEYSLHKPSVWQYLRPILLENKGWALFNGTYRGKNILWKMYQQAKKLPEWFNEELTIKDTFDEEGNPVISEADVEAERQAGMPEELIQQEFYCNPNAALIGAIVGDLMDTAEKEGRITNIPYDPSLKVTTAWDLGFDDTNTVWFIQFVGSEIRLIDCYSNNRKPAPHYVAMLNQKPYVYEEHFLPHDVEVHEYSTGYTRRETFENLGMQNIITVPRTPLADKYGLSEGHNAMRQILPRCYFDSGKCEEGVEGLKSYCRQWDDKLEKFSDSPLRNWAKHFADGFRQLACGINLRTMHPYGELPMYADQSYSELDGIEEANANWSPLDDYTY